MNKIIYNILITALSILSIAIAAIDIFSIKIQFINNLNIYYIDTAILVFFTIEFFIRILKSKNKKQFLKYNLFDLIAIIPFDSIFSFFRISRIIRISKVFKFLKFIKIFSFFNKIKNIYKEFIHTNGLIYVIYISLTTIFIASTIIYFTEKETALYSFWDAVWWSFVTCTTVGYGDITPTSTIGRITAIILMLVGIGTISMITSSISTFFYQRRLKEKYLKTKENLNINFTEKEIRLINNYRYNEDLQKSIDKLLDIE